MSDNATDWVDTGIRVPTPSDGWKYEVDGWLYVADARAWGMTSTCFTLDVPAGEFIGMEVSPDVESAPGYCSTYDSRGEPRHFWGWAAPQGAWLNVKLTYDREAGTMSTSVGGRSVVTSVPVNTEHAALTSVRIYAAGGWRPGNHTIEYLDDVSVRVWPRSLEQTATPPPGVSDVVPPTTACDAFPTYKGSAVIHLFPRDDPGGSGVAHTYYRLDGGPAKEGTLVVVPEIGAHALEFWSSDAANNLESPRSVVFSVSRIKTATRISILRGAASVRVGARLALSGALRPGLLSDRCVIEVRAPRSAVWKKIATSTVLKVSGAQGLWRCSFTPRRKGVHEFRSRFYGDATRLPCVSAPVPVVAR